VAVAKIDSREYRVEHVERPDGIAVRVDIRVYNRLYEFRLAEKLPILTFSTKIVGKFDDYYAGGKVDLDGLYHRARKQALGILKDCRRQRAD